MRTCVETHAAGANAGPKGLAGSGGVVLAVELRVGWLSNQRVVHAHAHRQVGVCRSISRPNAPDRAAAPAGPEQRSTMQEMRNCWLLHKCLGGTL